MLSIIILWNSLRNIIDFAVVHTYINVSYRRMKFFRVGCYHFESTSHLWTNARKTFCVEKQITNIYSSKFMYLWQKSRHYLELCNRHGMFFFYISFFKVEDSVSNLATVLHRSPVQTIYCLIYHIGSMNIGQIKQNLLMDIEQCYLCPSQPCPNQT